MDLVPLGVRSRGGGCIRTADGAVHGHEVTKYMHRNSAVPSGTVNVALITSPDVIVPVDRSSSSIVKLCAFEPSFPISTVTLSPAGSSSVAGAPPLVRRRIWPVRRRHVDPEECSGASAFD